MIEDPRPLVGRDIDDLDAAVLLVDLERFEANVAHLANHCRRQGVAWRPHSKVHKSPQIAAIEQAAGAIGVTCGKLSEAVVMVAHGVTEVLLANQLTSAPKLRRLARLQEGARVIGIVDDAEAIAMAGQAGTEVGQTIPLLVDIDIGMHRTGAQPGSEVVELARMVEATAGVEFHGIMGYEGHVLYLHPAADKELACRTALDHLVRTRDDLTAAGLPCPIVSAGGTGCYALTAAHDGITEIQAGGGIFMDAMYREKCHVGEELVYALSVLVTVTGRYTDHVVTDGGFKTMSAFHYPPQPLRDDLEFRSLSAEHGIYDLRHGGGPRLGERFAVLPGYSDSTTVLHNAFLAVRDGRVESVWELLGRGALT